MDFSSFQGIMQSCLMIHYLNTQKPNFISQRLTAAVSDNFWKKIVRMKQIILCRYSTFMCKMRKDVIE